MRRLTALAFLALLAAGCGGGGGGGGGGKAAGNPIAQAASRTSQAGSVRVEFSIAGEGIDGGGRGVFNSKEGGSGKLLMTIQSQGQSSTVETIAAGPVLYMRSAVFQQAGLPAGKEWVRLDLRQLARQQNVDLGSLVDSNPSPNGALAYLRGSTGAVQELGKEKVQGVETTHYKTTIDLEQAAKRATGTTRESIRRVITVAGVKRLPAEAWVDGDGYVRKLVYTQHSGRQQSAKITMELHDFGAPVSIASPPKSSVLDFQELLKPQGG